MKSKNLIILLTISLFSGLVFGQADIFGLMKVGFFLVLIIATSGIVLIVGAIKNRTKIIRLSGLVVILAVLSGITTLSTSMIKKNLKARKVEEIVLELNNYKKLNRVYPSDLHEIGYNSNNLRYSIDSLKKEFKLRYVLDGWHFREYSSETNEWVIGD